MVKARHLLLFLPLLLLLLVPSSAAAQTEADGNLRISPSLLQKRAEGVRFAGRRLETGVIAEGQEIVYKGVEYFYSGGGASAGLVAREVKTGEKIIYEPTELALKAGWLKERPGKDEPQHDHLRGYVRCGDVIWMGTDGFGVLAFDTKRKLWSRYDLSQEVRPGRDMQTVFYADEDYVFGGRLDVYSQKLKRWLRVDAIPTRYVRSLGYSGPYVQMPWSLTRFAKESYLPLIPYPDSLVLWWPQSIKLRDDGEAYIFKYEPEDAPTEFIIEKWQLEWAFSQAELNAPPPAQTVK